jgi:NAD(P)-dependent dehydrogenase (short-subunit alcohol dehydrogenase family)
VGQFDGNVALVSGGGSGIGAATARALAAEGALVHVADLDAAAARSVAAEVDGVAVELDVRDAQAWDAIAASAPFDLALLAAGVVGPRSVVDAAADEVDLVVDVDLLGVLHGTRALAAAMASRGAGRIVAVASAAGLFPMPLAPAYGAAKWGVVGWVLSAAPVLAGSGVTVTALCPAWTDTPFLPEEDRALLESLGQGIMPVPVVVDAALGLLSAGQPGQVLSVDAEHGAALATLRPSFSPWAG